MDLKCPRIGAPILRFVMPSTRRRKGTYFQKLHTGRFAFDFSLSYTVNANYFVRPKDAIKAIRKKLTTNAGKNFTVVMYTLTVRLKKINYLFSHMNIRLISLASGTRDLC